MVRGLGSSARGGAIAASSSSVAGRSETILSVFSEPIERGPFSLVGHLALRRHTIPPRQFIKNIYLGLEIVQYLEPLPFILRFLRVKPPHLVEQLDTEVHETDSK